MASMSIAASLRIFGPHCTAEAARRWKWALMLLVALVALVDLWALSNWRASVDPAVHGSLLVELGPLRAAGGWQELRQLDPLSPLRAAGASVGDEVRLRPGDGFLRDLRVDEPIPVELRSMNAVRHLAVRPVPDPDFSPGRATVGFVSGWLARVLALVIGALIVLRRAESPSLRALALYLILQNALGWFMPLPGGRFHDQGVMWLFPLLDEIAGLAALWSALQVQGDRPLWRHRWVRATFLVFVVLLALPLARWSLQWRIGGNAAVWIAVPLLDTLTSPTGYWFVRVLLVAAVLASFGSGRRKAHGVMRQRMTWVGVALGLPMAWAAVQDVLWAIWKFPSVQKPSMGTWPFLVQDVTFLIGCLILVWAVLRHRVFNLGLVVQRALVFSIISTALIIVLGLGKWLTETWLRASGGRHTFIYDAAIAMAVVGTFAILQTRVTSLANRLFFRSWREKAQALREFVEGAIESNDGAGVRSRFVQACDAFTGATGCALYAMGEDGHLHRVHASLADAPERIARASDLASSLAEARGKVDVSRLDGGHVADWAFPMAVHGEMSGALLVGPRGDGVAYRPEELAQLEESVRHVGLLLEALRVADLERAHRELERRYEELARASARVSAENAQLKGARSPEQDA
jgi:hypothetical protein